MKNVKSLAKLFLRDTDGATAIEYGIIAAAMGLILIPSMVVFGASTSGLFGQVAGLFSDIQGS